MPEKRGIAGRVFTALVTASFFGAMLALTVFLLGECGASGDAVEAYVVEIRSGASVSEAVGGAEADVLTEVLRETRSVSLGNFQGQAGTECVWATLRLEQGTRSARFVLAESGESYVVRRASLTRECDCPIDAQRPCHLE